MYIRANSKTVAYLALFNGDILDVYDTYDEAIADLKSEIDYEIADGGVDNIDFGECWVETNDDAAEVVYIADGDEDYAQYVNASTKVRSKYVKASTDVEYVLTEEGLRKVKQYVRELDAKRKEILDAGKDTIDETPNPVTVEDIEEDINFTGIDEDGEYYNGWYVTDNYDADYPISLMLGVDFIEQ